MKVISVNPLSANPTKWSNTPKQFVGKWLNTPTQQRTNSLSVFDYFVGLAPKELIMPLVLQVFIQTL